MSLPSPSSSQLTSNVFDYVVGSVTLSAIKRLLGVPVVVVTVNSKNVPTKPGASLRGMVVVEGHSRDMLSYMCTRMLDIHRGDKMLLGQVGAVCSYRVWEPFKISASCSPHLCCRREQHLAVEAGMRAGRTSTQPI